MAARKTTLVKPKATEDEGMYLVVDRAHFCIRSRHEAIEALNEEHDGYHDDPVVVKVIAQRVHKVEVLD